MCDHSKQTNKSREPWTMKMKLGRNKPQSQLLLKVHKGLFPRKISGDRNKIQVPQNGVKRKKWMKE